MRCDKKDLLLYGVTDRSWLGDRTLAQQVEASLRGGATMIQLREKHMDRGSILAQALELRELCGRYGVPLILNDDPELAQAAGADGVHVGQSDMEAGRVRALLGEDKLIGVSARTVEQALAGHIARDEETRRRLLELVHPFAPTVTDTFGVSAALSRALNLDERLSTARVKLEGARTLADSLPRPEEVSGGTDVEPRFDPAETAARLSAAEGELSRLRSGLAMAQGELNTLGDREALQTRREAIQEELDRRRAEYDALGAALAALEQAHSGLQARFSPALNRRAGELLAELTGGKYDKVALTQQFEALAEEHDGLQPRRALTLSQGTADQLYLAVRLAVCELVLPAEEPCPLVLDDALANFDDGRCALALEALARLGEERQILLFTCHSREARLAEGREGAAVLRLQS